MRVCAGLTATLPASGANMHASADQPLVPKCLTWCLFIVTVFIIVLGRNTEAFAHTNMPNAIRKMAWQLAWANNKGTTHG